MSSITQIVLSVCIAAALADVSHIVGHHTTTTPHPGPPNPYVFSYQAGRAPGHVDRQHTEVSDGSGVIRGAFSYVDPKNEVRTVQYVADENGFHPQLSHQLEDSEAVKAAKQKHFQLYNRIAQEHASGVQHPEVCKDMKNNVKKSHRVCHLHRQSNHVLHMYGTLTIYCAE